MAEEKKGAREKVKVGGKEAPTLGERASERATKERRGGNGVGNKEKERGREGEKKRTERRMARTRE